MNAESALGAYKTTKNDLALTDASPQKLIALLLDRALEHVSKARGAMDRGELADMGEAIGKAMTIISSLQASLNFEQGGDIANNLDSLYDFLTQLLLQATSEKNVDYLKEVSGLLTEIKDGWDSIPADMRDVAE